MRGGKIESHPLRHSFRADRKECRIQKLPFVKIRCYAPQSFAGQVKARRGFSVLAYGISPWRRNPSISSRRVSSTGRKVRPGACAFLAGLKWLRSSAGAIARNGPPEQYRLSGLCWPEIAGAVQRYICASPATASVIACRSSGGSSTSASVPNRRNSRAVCRSDPTGSVASCQPSASGGPFRVRRL